MAKKPALLHVVDENRNDAYMTHLSWKEVFRLLFYAKRLCLDLKIVWGSEQRTYYLNTRCQIRYI